MLNPVPLFWQSDRDLLRAFRKEPSSEHFRPFLDRYLNFVLASTSRQLGSEAEATEAARAAFVALASRGRKLPRNTRVFDWLFRASHLAARKLRRKHKSTTAGSVDLERLSANDPWNGIAPHCDKALFWLPRKLREAVLLVHVLRRSEAEAATILHVRRERATRRASKGIRKLVRRLRRRKQHIPEEVLTSALLQQGLLPPAPDALNAEITALAKESFRRNPKLDLARWTLGALTWCKWKRRLKVAGACVGVFAMLLGALVLSAHLLWRSGRLLPLLMEFGQRMQVKSHPELVQPAKPWPVETRDPLPSATMPRSGADLYRTTNIWMVHLTFSPSDWKALTPKPIPPVPSIVLDDGTLVLRNPNSKRSGVAGALGLEFDWVKADLNFGGETLSNVGARWRGNGTYLSSRSSWKRPIKVDLNKYVKKQQLAGVQTLNLANLVEDSSRMSDALGYELFREAHVPSPRTAYAWVTISIVGQWEQKPLGLYLLVENVDEDFAADRFGSKQVPIFKPVTYDLFKDLGDDWAPYAPIYDLKTAAAPAQQRRLIEFARLVTHAPDAEFAQRVAEFLDVDEFAGFVAGLVLLSSYDGFLSTGQNFYLYLDPRTDRFGFIPWDLDHAWGGFPLVGTIATRERASIWQPWTGRNRFLERVMKVEAFRRVYRQRLNDLAATAFASERLNRRIDEIAAIIRSPVTAESDYRLKRFDLAVNDQWIEGAREGAYDDPNRPVHQLKRFIASRAKSVRDQLDGKTQGIVLTFTGL